MKSVFINAFTLPVFHNRPHSSLGHRSLGSPKLGASFIVLCTLTDAPSGPAASLAHPHPVMPRPQTPPPRLLLLLLAAILGLTMAAECPTCPGAASKCGALFALAGACVPACDPLLYIPSSTVGSCAQAAWCLPRPALCAATAPEDCSVCARCQPTAERGIGTAAHTCFPPGTMRVP